MNTTQPLGAPDPNLTVNLPVLQNQVFNLDSFTGLSQTPVPSSYNYVNCNGYYGGGSPLTSRFASSILLRRVPTQPSHPLYGTDALGAFWEYAPGQTFTMCMLGGIPTGVRLAANTTALNNWVAYINYLQASNPYGTPVDGRNYEGQRLIINQGPGFIFPVNTTILFTGRALWLEGESRYGCVLGTNDGVNAVPLIQLGASLAAKPTTMYPSGATSAGYCTFRNIQFENVYGSGWTHAGARVGYGIQHNGSGFNRVEYCQFIGWKVGYQSLTSDQFGHHQQNTYRECDVGRYLGPGTQQVTSINNLFTDNIVAELREWLNTISTLGDNYINNGAVDYSGGHIQYWFNNNTTTPTTQGVDMSLCTDLLTSDVVIVDKGIWFESSSGSAGTQVFPSAWVSLNGNPPDAIRGITMEDVEIIGGLSGVAGGRPANSAFIVDNTTTNGGLVRIFRPKLQGGFDSFCRGQLGHLAVYREDYRVPNGFTGGPMAASGDPNSCSYVDYNTSSRARYAYAFADPSWDIGSAIPTTNTGVNTQFSYQIGSVRQNNLTVTADVFEWVCTTTGAPGTWRAKTWNTKKGATGSRPTLAATDIGVTYMDTTIAAGGEPIMWNGSAWVNNLGVPV